LSRRARGILFNVAVVGERKFLVALIVNILLITSRSPP
jgi:hypothetical protein